MKQWKDFLGRPLAVGDFVGHVARQGTKPYIGLAKIIDFTDDYVYARNSYGWGYGHARKSYTLAVNISRYSHEEYLVKLPTCDIPQALINLFLEVD